jgi:hypothetical protein
MLAARAGSASIGGNIAPMLAASPSAHDHIVMYKRIGTIVFLAISIQYRKNNDRWRNAFAFCVPLRAQNFSAEACTTLELFSWAGAGAFSFHREESGAPRP